MSKVYRSMPFLLGLGDNLISHLFCIERIEDESKRNNP